MSNVLNFSNLFHVTQTHAMMSVCKKIKIQGDDPYNIGEDSDSDDEMGYKSSDEELEICNRIMNEVEDKAVDSDSEDDFEKEMQKELDESLLLKASQDINNDKESSSSAITSSTANTGENTKHEKDNDDAPKSAQLYDEDYFSSGSEDNDMVGGIPSKSRGRREVLTNDELFYDPHMDDEDEKWVTKQRQQNANKLVGITKKDTDASKQKSKSKVQKVPTSDAILSCPACMSILSIDCQRHDIYKSQYRAMFVMNCEVIKDEVLKYQDQRHKNIGKRKGKQKGKLVPDNMERQSSSQNVEYEQYNPVKCSECGTEVAVFDKDEVYHFFNVLASYA